MERWNEPHRHYHNIDFLEKLISSINEDFGDGFLSETDRDKLVLTALFHKLIYEPIKEDNEEKSSEVFHRFCGEKYNIDLVEVKQMILDLKRGVPCTPLSKKFLDYNMSICQKDFESLLTWEKSLREEYSMVENSNYKEKRIKYLESCLENYPLNMDNLLDLINWVNSNY